jgi:hypothetical protein
VLTDKRKTINGEDILYAMTALGFDNYQEAGRVYLAKYRNVGSGGLVFNWPRTISADLT